MFEGIKKLLKDDIKSVIIFFVLMINIYILYKMSYGKKEGFDIQMADNMNALYSSDGKLKVNDIEVTGDITVGGKVLGDLNVENNVNAGNSVSADVDVNAKRNMNADVNVIAGNNVNASNNLYAAVDIHSEHNINAVNVNSSGYFNQLPTGTILPYIGDVSNIPSGWALCDGQNGRPDFRNKFLLGTEVQAKLGETGGAFKRKIETKHLPPHSHPLQLDVINAKNGKDGGTVNNNGAAVIVNEGSHTKYSVYSDKSGSQKLYGRTWPVGNGVDFDTYPPYYKVNYIIKL